VTSSKSERWGFLALAAWFALVAAATGVWRNVPLIDDWAYAWTVEQLLQTGRFKVLDWSSTYPVSQAIWGAAWSAVLGFSFASLRISTLVLGIVCCGAVYLTIRELDASRRLAWLGAISLAVNPLFVLLSSSFMTDVPFITFTALALLCYVRAANRGDSRLVWWGGAWSLAAFLTRQVGLITPVAGLPLLLWPGEHSRNVRIRAAIALAVTWAVIGIALTAMRHSLGTTSVMTRWMWNLRVRPSNSNYLLLNMYLLVLVGFYMLPALLVRASAQRLWRRRWVVAGALVATAAFLLAVLGTIPLPLRPDQTWNLVEVGASRVLVHGRLPERALGWLDVPLRAVTIVSTMLLLIVLLGRRGPLAASVSFVRLAAAEYRRACSRCAKASAERRRPAGPESRTDPLRAWALGRVPLVLYVAVYLVLTNLLWMYNDRYYLAMVPPLIALALAGCRSDGDYPRSACVAMMLFGAIAVAGTGDALRFNEAVRDAWQGLVDAGVPPSQIDAGYAWNGWMLYAHPANLGSGQTPLRDVPWVTSARRSEYVIATAPLAGYSVRREVTWRGLPWPGPDRLFVLRQVYTTAPGKITPSFGTMMTPPRM
jgi:Dolichyl-phosphate-mannose-protein mannosyltransferase